jgi:molybdopterin-guanine dinucleotide biosynthesis protein MobB
MKVIHIAGFSNTGKTTFISALIPELKKIGTVGVVKHIGHHGYSLAEGKDTTRFFSAGAVASAGIDARKSVLILQENHLEQVLGILCDSGVEYAVVEGFKERPSPKVIIGEVPGAENVLLRDPSVEDVLAHLDEFSDLTTPEGLSKELQRNCTPDKSILVSTISIQGCKSKEQIRELSENLNEKVREIGDVSIRLEYSGYMNPESPQKIMIGVCAPDSRLAIEAALIATDLLLPFIIGEGE